MPEQELILQGSNQDVEFGTFRSPASVISEAEMVARAFGKKAEQLQLYKKIGDSKHLQIEGWQLLASMYRVTAGIKSTNFVQFGDAHGFEATAEAIHVPTGRVISTAEAMCLNDEEKWGAVSKYEWQQDPNGDRIKVKVGEVAKPLQQLRSMAQTRACSKVLSNLLKHIAKMSGFAGTPSEEMTGNEYDNSGGNGNGFQQPQRKSAAPGANGGGTARKISEPQRKRLWAIAHQSGKDNDAVIAIIKTAGFEKSDDITMDKYEAICAEVQKGDAAD